MRQIGLDLVRVTEAAAIAASKWVGSGQKELADKAATDAMRDRLNRLEFCAVIAIGEGKKDESYGLYEGELVGQIAAKAEMEQFRDALHRKNPCYEIAVDPIEGTRPVVTSGPEAISTLAIAEKGGLYHTDEFYMMKLAYNQRIKDRVTLSLEDPIERTIELTSIATGKEASEIMVCVLDRDRHTDIVSKLRERGVRIKLIQDCDVSGAIATCLPDSGIDLLYGIGGAPEAVISACAIKCLHGGFQARVVESTTWKEKGRTLYIDDLIKSECVFAATGITPGSILDGVICTKHGKITHSIFMRSQSGTIRNIATRHGN